MGATVKADRPWQVPVLTEGAIRRRLRQRVPGSWLRRLERLIRWDPNERGIAGDRDLGILACVRGDLRRAARRLARPSGHVVLVTGFPVRTPLGLRAETDGPLGAALLAATLSELGWRVHIVTDGLCFEVVRACAEALSAQGCHLACEALDELPSEPAHAQHRLRTICGGDEPSVVIAVERPGRSHTPSTARLNGRPDPVFAEVVPSGDWDCYHNCRGERLSELCVPLDRWFEPACGSWFTVGIGDGGNEIGMGKIPWRLLHVSVRGGVGGVIASRVPAAALVVSGVSNWGAYGLAIAAARYARRPEAARWIQPAMERLVMEAALAAGAVDGLSGRAIPLVDGQPLALHGQLIVALRRAARLPEP